MTRRQKVDLAVRTLEYAQELDAADDRRTAQLLRASTMGLLVMLADDLLGDELPPVGLPAELASAQEQDGWTGEAA